jgi:hypothetical protein
MPKQRPAKRGPKPSPDSARVTLGVKLSADEKARVEKAASRDGTTASKWARDVIVRALP